MFQIVLKPLCHSRHFLFIKGKETARLSSNTEHMYSSRFYYEPRISVKKKNGIGYHYDCLLLSPFLQGAQVRGATMKIPGLVLAQQSMGRDTSSHAKKGLQGWQNTAVWKNAIELGNF